jgi:phosphomannomutase
VLNRNRLIALASAIVLRDHPGSCIVTDSVSSLGVERFIRERGGKHVRYMKG